MSEKVTKWVSKWALAGGFVECFVGEIKGWYFLCYPGNYPRCIGKNNVHETEEAAIAKARQMRDKKIASLRAQIKKLEGMFV